MTENKIVIQVERKKGFGNYGILGWSIFFIYLVLEFFMISNFILQMLLGWIFTLMTSILPFICFIGIIYGVFTHQSKLSKIGWIVSFILSLIALFLPLLMINWIASTIFGSL